MRRELAGIPEDVLQAAREAAQAEGKPGWKFTLHAPSYLPVMQYAENRALRELMYRAYVTRASEFGKPEWDNTALIAEIVQLRQELARLLGFANYAEYSLEPKMAESPRQVLEFLDELAARAKPYAERDLEELTAFARDELGLDRPAGVGPRLCFREAARGALRVLRPGSEAVLSRKRRCCPACSGWWRRLYGLHIEPEQAPVWHPDVRFFAIRDRDGALIGQFYVDLYARPSKRGGAWMDEVMNRRRKDGRLQTPVAYLNCNFSAPVGGKPALFTHDEVITLFHEFGHGLHHLLTRVEVLGAAGINGVEWDAVELPSQFMENFCWEWDVLAPMTSHVDTGAPLPRALFDKMLAAKNFQSGMQTVRQLEFALFDLHLHYDYDPRGAKSVLQLLDEVRSARGGGVSARVQPVSAQLLARLRRRLCGGLLQLQVGRGALRGCLQPVRGERRARSRHRHALLGRDPRRGRQPPGARVVRRFPRAGAEDGRPAPAQRHERGAGRQRANSRMRPARTLSADGVRTIAYGTSAAAWWTRRDIRLCRRIGGVLHCSA